MVDENLKFLSTSLEFCSVAFGVAKKMFPEAKSMLTVSGPEYQLIMSGEIELHDIKLRQEKDEVNSSNSQ